MGRLTDYIGLTFGRLRVREELVHLRTRHDRVYRCECECGRMTTVARTNLRNGHSRSCGCLGRELRAMRNRTHGRTKTPEYRIWRNIKTRCTNQNNVAYPLYGGRGISLYEPWAKSFEAFLADVGLRPSPSLTLDRINNDGNYEPGNVRWATPKEQANNRRTRVNSVCGRCGKPYDYIRPSGQRGCKACKAATLRAWRRRRQTS